jgi:hypothetical protein
MTDTPVRFIRRPATWRNPGRRGSGYPYAELRRTLGTKQAILLPGGGETLARALDTMRHKMHREGFRIRTADHPDGLALWLEPKPPRTS